MSSKNNVNKDFYTLAGRDRPNEHVVEMAIKHLPDELPGHHGGSRPNFIPGAAAGKRGTTRADAARRRSRRAA